MGIEISAVVGYPINDEVERVLGLAETVGEPVTVTFMWEGHAAAERHVLVPAATLALWEHWAPGSFATSEAGGGVAAEPETWAEPAKTAQPAEAELAHPQEFGPFTLFRRRVGGRTAVARGGVVVAELVAPDEARWLEEQAREVRQGFMDPKQKAAFEEFLARQPPVEGQ